MQQERELAESRWAEKHVTCVKSIETAVTTQLQQNVDASDSNRDQSSEDQGPVAEFANERRWRNGMRSSPASNIFDQANSPVEDEEVTRA